MKKKTNLLSSFFIVGFAFLSLLQGCDMDGVVPTPFSPGDNTGNGGRGTSDGRSPAAYSYLTIFNLPPNVDKNNVQKVFVSNQVSKLGSCRSYDDIIVENNGASSTVKIPLVYYSDNNVNFDLTGSYFTSFDINIDASTRLTVSDNDKLVLNFIDGNARFDASLIGKKQDPFFTIINLPFNTQKNHFSNVFVYNSSGALIAECSDYDQIVISRDSSSAAAAIPLSYNGRNDRFIDTGDFIITFFADINSSTQFIVNQEDNLTLFFASGNAILDASVFLAPPPFLTIYSLPKNAKPQDFSKVFVYDDSGLAVAECHDYHQILITAGSDYAAAKIPLVYSGSLKPFRGSGILNSSFSFTIANYINVEKPKNDAVKTKFSAGSGALDFPVKLGFFSGALTNPSDANAPVVKAGTVFELNGSYHTIDSNTNVLPASFPNSSVVYVYARLSLGRPEFFLSAAHPVYDDNIKGFYSGASRALFKLVFVLDSPNKFFAKTYIADPFPHLSYQTTQSNTLPSQNLLLHYFLSGAGNPRQHTVTLPAGAYLITLSGAAGGSSDIDASLSSVSTKHGGAGGLVSEAVVLSKKTSFTFFTGEKGRNGSRLYSTSSSDSGTGGSGSASEYFSGAGGGSGTFAFSSDGYLLCAGGGGGAAGTSLEAGSFQQASFSYTGGGAGGSIGGGGSGGTTAPEVLGGAGGGFPGGFANGPVIYGYSELTAHSYSLGYAGTGSNTNLNGNHAAYFNLPTPYTWLNTNNANGKGGEASSPAQAGGNNRNSSRAGGGEPSDSDSYALQSHGFINVYIIN